MKLFSATATAALLVVLQLLHTQPGTAAATVSSPAAAPAGLHRRTQWWATAIGGGNLGGGGKPNLSPTRPPPTLPTGGDYLQFVEREPDFRLGRCEGDCDKDSVRSCVHNALNWSLEMHLGTRFSLVLFGFRSHRSRSLPFYFYGPAPTGMPKGPHMLRARRSERLCVGVQRRG